MFTQNELHAMLELSQAGVKEIVKLQKEAIVQADLVDPGSLESLGEIFKKS